MKTLDLTAKLVCYDKQFQPMMNEEGWCEVRAYLKEGEVLDVRGHEMQVIDCGFDIKLPPDHELHFRPARGSRWLLLDASNPDFAQRRVHVSLINFAPTAAFVRHGDHLGDMCVRPTNNVPIIPEAESE